MRTKGIIRRKAWTTLAIAVLMALVVSAGTQPSPSRSEPKRSVLAKTQPSELKTQGISAPEAPESQALERAPAKAEPEAQILKDTRAYERALRDLAGKAENIVKAMPEDPSQISKNFHDIRGVLIDARTNLVALLDRRKEIESLADTVLRSAAAVRQSFVDLAKRIDDSTDQLRRKATDNPQAVESAARAMQGIKEACQRGDAAVSPLRELVMQTHREAQSVFVELEAYPQIFSYAIEAADLYEKGLGEPASYISVVQGLYKARENLRAII